MSLLDRLVAEKLEREAETVRGEGWRWVEIRADISDTWQWRRIEPQAVELDPGEQAELDEAGQCLDELKPDGEELTEAEAAEADAVCNRIDRLEARTERWQPERWRPEDIAASGAVVTLGYDGRLRVERGLVRPGEKPPINDTIGDDDLPEAGAEDSAGRKRHAEPDRLPGERAALWDWLVAQSRDERLDLLAHCVALLIHGVRIPHMGEGRGSAADRLGALVGLDMADWWRPTKESYLGRIPKTRILDAIAEAVSPEEAAKLSGLKKAELVDAADALLKDRRWLPAVLHAGESAQAGKEQTQNPLA